MKNPPLIDDDLKAELEIVYGPRLHEVLDSFSCMGSRFHFRLNTLKDSRESLVRRIIDNGLAEARVDERLPDAAYVPSKVDSLVASGVPVEADRFAAEAILHGAHLYAPGVKKCHGLKPGTEASVVSEDGIVVGNGLARQSEEMIIKSRSGIAVEITQNKYGIPSFMDKQSFEQGLFHPQSLPAMVTCHVLDPQPNETIVDLNAAPGGKLSYICQLTQNKAKVVGFDRNRKKLDKATKHLERLGCENYSLSVHDSRYAHENFMFRADKVMVDPPCTGLGIVPKLAVNVRGKDVRSLSEYQKQFLTAAFHMVRSGGTVVYSVCTVTWQECEGIIEHASRLGLVVDEAVPMIGARGLDERRMTQRFDPDIHGTGYFIAKFLRP